MSDDEPEGKQDEPEHIVKVRFRHFKRWNRDLYIAECITCFWEGQAKEEAHVAAQNRAGHLHNRHGRVEPYDPLAE